MKNLSYKLNDFSEQKKIKEQACEAFKEIFKIYLEDFKEEAAELGIENFDFCNADICELTFCNDLENRAAIRTEIRIFNSDDEEAGYYHAFFNESGEMEDDILVIE